MAQIIGIGIDVIDATNRKATKLLVARVLSAGEMVRYDSFRSKKAASDYFFGRWAAKEAFYKATGRTEPFSKIEIGSLADGKPFLKLPKDCKVMISISHDKRMFAAVVVALSP